MPKGGSIKGDDKEEGLVPYDAVIPDERKWTISHINEVPVPCFLSRDFSATPFSASASSVIFSGRPETVVNSSYSGSQKS